MTKGQAAVIDELAQYIHAGQKVAAVSLSSLGGRGGAQESGNRKILPKSSFGSSAAPGKGRWKAQPSPPFRTSLKTDPSFTAHSGVRARASLRLQSAFPLPGPVPHMFTEVMPKNTSQLSPSQPVSQETQHQTVDLKKSVK